MELIFNSPEEKKPEVLFFPVLADQKYIEKIVKSLNYDNEAAIVRRIKKESFKGKKDQVFVVHDQSQVVVFLGSGRDKKISSDDWRILSGDIVAYLKKYNAKSIGLEVDFWLKGNRDISRLSQSLAEGMALASYNFEKYKKENTEEIKVNIQKIFVYLRAKDKNKFKKGFDLGLLMAKGTIKGRDLVNEPAGNMTPSFLAKEALSIAKENKNIQVKILEKDQASKMGMEAFLSISRGSDEEPKFIHLVYKPKVKTKEKIALVGKGITFDSGGLNIKPWEAMQQMKIDMGGAAAVLGVFSVLDKIRVKAEVHGIIAACENMASGSAIKPGDVVKNMQGKSIEIGHTDAEGRVTLADSLAYAQKQNVGKIVDLATLTGSIISALGPQYAGLFSSDSKMSDKILKAADFAGEKMWQMPMALEYKEVNQSKVADIKNISNIKTAGSIAAAWFLKYFVEDEISWAHIDIAGPVYAEKSFNSYVPIGGVGYGVRTLLEWLRSF